MSQILVYDETVKLYDLYILFLRFYFSIPGSYGTKVWIKMGPKTLKIEARGRGTPSDFGMDQISILDALVALELSWWRLGKFEKVLGGRFGTVLSGSWVPTWVPKWSHLWQKIDPKIDHFLDASWNWILGGFWWMLGAEMEPSWHQHGIKNRFLRKHEKTNLELAR